MAQRQVDVPWWQRQMQKLASTRAGAWLFSHTLHHVDRVLMRLSGGRIAVPQTLAGLPTIRLTTTGAKTGKERTVPLLGLQDGDRWVLFASNWGGADHPAWYYNLRANPEVELTHDDRTEKYVAREANDEERAEYWEQATSLYVGFEPYQRRTDREIPVVVLEPTEE